MRATSPGVARRTATASLRNRLEPLDDLREAVQQLGRALALLGLERVLDPQQPLLQAGALAREQLVAERREGDRDGAPVFRASRPRDQAALLEDVERPADRGLGHLGELGDAVVALVA